MALTQTAEYALRAVVWLAQHPGQPLTTRQIAEATQVPSSYLPKVFHPLVRAGLVGGQRGLRGGYSLLKEPSDITLLDVVQQVDPVQHIVSCPLALASHRGRLCPLHSLLEQLIVAEEETLRATRLSDLVGQPGEPTPLCNTLARTSTGSPLLPPSQSK
jgi:Rrf2 family nitric oxide-sensitive transcriptional repressor